MIREGAQLRADSIRYLTGENAARPHPAAIGQKFDNSGRVLRFPGNTFICHIDPESVAHAALTRASLALKSGPLADGFTFLPPSSFHMTVFEGVCDQHRADDRWPKAMASDCDLTSVTQSFEAAVEGLVPPQSHYIRPTGIFGGFSVAVSGATDADETSLRRVRQALRVATTILREDFETYDFHITLAYNLRWFTRAEAESIMDLSDSVFADLAAASPEIRLGPVEFCTFEDMHAFVPKRILRD